MKSILLLLSLCSLSLSKTIGQKTFLQTEREYVEAWKNFYPTKALNMGFHEMVFNYEDRSENSIQNWLKLNEKILQEMEFFDFSQNTAHRINSRMLKAEIKRELHQWGFEKPQSNSALFYARLIDKAINLGIDHEYLTLGDLPFLICQRLEAIQELCLSAQTQLKQSSQLEKEKSIVSLEKSIIFFEQEFKNITEISSINPTCISIEDQHKETIIQIQNLIDFIANKIKTKQSDAILILGKEEYTRRLNNYVDQEITPEALASMALDEINNVRQLIQEVSRAYIKKTYGETKMPGTKDEIIQLAFRDMENDAPKDGQDYLEFWQELAAQAIQFIEDHQIATLPEFQTLEIINAPESAGPAARIGWVDSAAPFDPNPVTTLYLPSIPDSLPEAERIDFWSSFNKPFNRMIAIHELFPGHYMQIKVSRETPHKIRLLFPYGPYFEGWATLTEEVLLDAGWEKERPLTYLAHLRKRLENANRAYTSVMVHCEDWKQEDVMKFSTTTSLLAPQFAKSLWGRLMRSPMQMTSYFYGGSLFRDLWIKEKTRLGEKFDLKYFMDTIMKTGPVPIDEFYTIFELKQ